MIPTTLQSVRRTFQRRHGKHDPVFGYATIMDHAAEGSFVPALLGLDAVCVDGVDNNIAGAVVAVAACFVRETDHFARVRVEFGVGGHGGRCDLAVEIVAADGFECCWVHGEGWTVFFCCEEDAAPEGDVGVCRCADYAFYGFAVCEVVAVAPEETFFCCRFVVVAVCSHVSLLEVCMAVFDADCCHTAIAIKMDVVLE